MGDDVFPPEQKFYNAVREYIIWLLLFMLLYVSSYFIICVYKRKADKEEYPSIDPDDAFVYKITMWICTFTLSVSAGAVLLLPMSIAANEALILFPESYYLQWVNSSLIHGLWNHIFFSSNLCFFVLLPFAYLFTESEGLPGSKKSIMSRVYETLLVLFLISIVVCGLAWVMSALINKDQQGRAALFDLWNFYLPYLYSCISLLGVVMLLICTPVGFARMFTVIGDLVVKPQFFSRDLNEEINTVRFEEETIRRKIDHQSSKPTLANGHSSTADLQSKLDEMVRDRREIEKRQQISTWRRNLGYPLVMILLLAFTTLSGFLVTMNTFELLIGLKALPDGTTEMVLGISSLSALGPIGASIEIILILYLMLASVVGVFSLPLLNRLKPRPHETPMTGIVGVGALLLILSSALPVLSRTLGITNFDLMGHFRSIEWLGNWTIILSYNLIFGVSTALCLFTTFTATLRQELLRRLQSVFRRGPRTSSVSINGDISHLKDE